MNKDIKNNTKQSDSGYTYKQYLQFMLYLKNEETVIVRMMDLIEEKMHKLAATQEYILKNNLQYTNELMLDIVKSKFEKENMTFDMQDVKTFNELSSVMSIDYKLEGDCDDDYPLQAKGRPTREYLREIAYLRPRTNLFRAVFRIRNIAAYAIHNATQEEKQKFFANFKKTRDEKNQKIYNHTKSKTEAEYKKSDMVSDELPMRYSTGHGLPPAEKINIQP